MDRRVAAVTVNVKLLEIAATVSVAVIVAVPGVTAEMRPDELGPQYSIVATAVLLDEKLILHGRPKKICPMEFAS